MGRQAAAVLYVLALVAVVVGVDVLFFRNQFWERLIVNVGIDRPPTRSWRTWRPRPRAAVGRRPTCRARRAAAGRPCRSLRWRGPAVQAGLCACPGRSGGAALTQARRLHSAAA